MGCHQLDLGKIYSYLPKEIKYKNTQFTVWTDEQPSLLEFKDDDQSKSYLRMPTCAASFPPSPAVPSSMDTPSAPRSSSTSLARILPPWKERYQIATTYRNFFNSHKQPEIYPLWGKIFSFWRNQKTQCMEYLRKSRFKGSQLLLIVTLATTTN